MCARVLVIEDNKDSMDLMVYLLRAFGYDPVIARDGTEGINAALRETPSLVLCDILLPDMDGYEIAARFKGTPELVHVPLVAVTALAMAGDREKALRAGFDGYLAKPIVPQRLIAEVQGRLANSPPVPVPVPVPHAPSQPQLPAHPSRGITILVVDDTMEERQLMESILEPCGYRVVGAKSAGEGLRAARQLRPSLIVADVHMPEDSGLDFIRMVKGDPELQSIPFMFVSSTVQSAEIQREALARGAVKFIVRPIGPADLIAEVEGALRDKLER